MPLHIENGKLLDRKTEVLIWERQYQPRRGYGTNIRNLFRLGFHPERFPEPLTVNSDSPRRADMSPTFNMKKYRMPEIRILQGRPEPDAPYCFVADIIPWQAGMDAAFYNPAVCILTLKQVWWTLLEEIDRQGFHTVTAPLLGLTSRGFPREIAAMTAAETVSTYFRETGSKLDVTLVLTQTGLPEDVEVGSPFEMRAAYQRVSQEDRGLRRELTKQLENAGFTMSWNLIPKLDPRAAFEQEIQALLKESGGNGSYRQCLHRKACDMLYRVKLLFQISYNTLCETVGISAGTLSKFRKDPEKKMEKNTAIRLAVGMMLSGEDALRFIWSATQEQFPEGSREMRIMDFLMDSGFEPEEIRDYSVDIGEYLCELDDYLCYHDEEPLFGLGMQKQIDTAL